MKKFAFIFFLSIVSFVFARCSYSILYHKVKIREYVFIVEISTNKEMGLSFRKSMPWNHGMLFIYDSKDIYSFWMKDMQFPLDFLWIEENQIVDITQKVPVPAGDTIPTCEPRVPVDKVLELNAGIVESLKISTGDTIQILD